MNDISRDEVFGRIAIAQNNMIDFGIDALFICTEAEFFYFTGFRTQFWQSPARPWFLVIPAKKSPIAIIPEIGLHLFKTCGFKQVITWPSPRPRDEGISDLIKILKKFHSIGLSMGPESSLRMPLNDLLMLQSQVGSEWRDATPIIRKQRMIKSKNEIKFIKKICNIGGLAFSKVPKFASSGDSLISISKQFTKKLLDFGADYVPYLAVAAGHAGYCDIISPPNEKKVETGDILILDTGATFKGYFCDFDRNFSFGKPNKDIAEAYRLAWIATENAISYAKPGMAASQLFDIMNKTIGSDNSSVGRFGHGLGIQLTEWPSVCSHDHTTLMPGMVITIEPSVEFGKNFIMVHEENIIITDTGAEILTLRAPSNIEII